MPDWANLRDAYGYAIGVPAIIERWRDVQDPQALTDLWSHLCHQGTVYSASFAALPSLIETARLQDGKGRRDAVMLAASIVASRDVQGDRPNADVAALLPELKRLSEQCLTHADVDDQEFIYLLQAFRAACEDTVWGVELERLAGEEYEGLCVSCDGTLLFAIGSRGFFATAEDYITKPSALRIAIIPADPIALPDDGRSLENLASAHGRTDVAQGIRYVFGTTRCPVCDTPLEVDAAIKALLQRF